VNILHFFIGLSVLLWLTTFGYFIVLWILSRMKRPIDRSIEEWPDVAVVVPTYNEEQFISAKFSDLNSIDYPSERLHIYIVDAGSTDQTIVNVQEKINGGEKIQLMVLEGIRNKIEQVTHSLSLLKEQFIVFTDADSRLEPGCIRQLIRLLIADPQTAIAGAMVIPETALLEEKIHWTLLNHLWWLEGEAFSAAGFSGVCYAMRKDSVTWLDKAIKAEDIHLSLTACAGGHRVRLVQSAIAYELRVPQNVQDFFQFRRRRGSRYVTALRHFDGKQFSPISWRLVRGMRLWQFRMMPWLAIAFVILLLFLLTTDFWIYTIVALLAFILSGLGVVNFLHNQNGKRVSWRNLFSSSARYFAFLMISLLTLNQLPLLESKKS
jgi:cellulose synthase/poly-beta-1,6-N-acetylglucosamine synthase-like glycosyltransferase